MILKEFFKQSKEIWIFFFIILIICIISLIIDLNKNDKNLVMTYSYPIGYIDHTDKNILDHNTSYNFNKNVNCNYIYATKRLPERLFNENRVYEDSIYFTRCQQERIPIEYTLDEVRMLCTMVYGECGAISNNVEVTFYDKYNVIETVNKPAQYMHSLCAMILLNRIKDNRFPDTIYENLIRPKQYTVLYTYESQSYKYLTGIGSNWSNVVDAVIDCLTGEFTIPKDVIFQSNYSNLGKYYYATIYVDTGYFRSMSYYAYG